MSENFFKKCIGGVENLSEPPTQGTVSASGGELKAIGSFSARISVDGLFNVKPAEAKIVVYKNLNADLLLGTAFFVRASREGGGKFPWARIRWGTQSMQGEGWPGGSPNYRPGASIRYSTSTWR